MSESQRHFYLSCISEGSMLTSPNNVTSLFSLINFSERRFRYSSLNSVCYMHEILYIHPTAIFLKSFWNILIKSDSSSHFINHSNIKNLVLVYIVDCFFDIQQHSPISWFSWNLFSVKIFQLNICYWLFESHFFDFDMKLCNSSKWNNKLMFKWNKEKGLPMSLKIEFRSLIVKYLVMFFSGLIALMKFSNFICFLIFFV